MIPGVGLYAEMAMRDCRSAEFTPDVCVCCPPAIAYFYSNSYSFSVGDAHMDDTTLSYTSRQRSLAHLQAVRKRSRSATRSFPFPSAATRPVAANNWRRREVASQTSSQCFTRRLNKPGQALDSWQAALPRLHSSRLDRGAVDCLALVSSCVFRSSGTNMNSAT